MSFILQELNYVLKVLWNKPHPYNLHILENILLRSLSKFVNLESIKFVCIVVEDEYCQDKEKVNMIAALTDCR